MRYAEMNWANFELSKKVATRYAEINQVKFVMLAMRYTVHRKMKSSLKALFEAGNAVQGTQK